MSSNVFEKDKRKTLQVSLPLGQTLGLAVLLLLLFWGVSEGVLRFLVFYSLIDTPLIGSTNSEFDYKLSKLDRYVKENGRVDCIFLGSSQFDDGADPQAFAERYEELSGSKLSCFNFSIATLTASPAAEIAQILTRLYRPKLIVYGTSARDYSENFGEMARPLFEDPWVMFQFGQYSLRGWLIDHSYAVRVLAVIRRNTNPEYVTFSRRTLKRIRTDGYLPLVANNLELDKKIYVSEYVKSREDMLGLERLVQMNSSGTRIVFVEVPVHQSFMPIYVESGEESYYKLFVDPISKYVRDHGVLFLVSQREMQKLIPDSGWGDIKHLNVEGSAIYSRWMAESIYETIRSNQMKTPF